MPFFSRASRRGRDRFPQLGTLEVLEPPDVAHDVHDFSFGGMRGTSDLLGGEGGWPEGRSTTG